MRKLLLLFFLFFYLRFCYGQLYSWAAADNHYNPSYGAALAKDAAGNLFVAQSIPSGICLIKFNVLHNIVWRHTITGDGVCSLAWAGLCTDNSGSIYLTSRFDNTISVDSIIIASASGGNMFLLKFDPQGVFKWVRHSVGSWAGGRKVSSDARGNVYVAGNLNGDVYFDTVHISSPVVYNYIAKYNSNGQFQWVRFGTSWSFAASTYGLSIQTDAASNTYLAGTFYTWAKFGNISINAYNNSEAENIYLAKIDSLGNWIWAVGAGGNNQDAIYNMDLDKNGNVYLTGFLGSATAKFGNYTLNNASGNDCFVAKCDPNGSFLWAVREWQSGSLQSFCVDKSGNSYLPTDRKFIMKYDQNGNFSWSQVKYASNMQMVAADSGKIFVTGYFQDTISFGKYFLTANQSGQKQIFIAELDDTTYSTTGIKEKTIASDLRIFPNPLQGKLQIRYTSSSKGEITIRIENMDGTIVYAENIFCNGELSKEIDMKNNPKGIYLVEVIVGGERSVRKIVLK